MLPSITGEIRIKDAMGANEQVFKITHVGCIDVKNDFVEVSGWDGERRLLEYGSRRVNFSDVGLVPEFFIPANEWEQISAIVQAAGTGKGLPSRPARNIDPVLEATVNEISRTFLLAEAKREEERYAEEYDNWD